MLCSSVWHCGVRSFIEGMKHVHVFTCIYANRNNNAIKQIYFVYN